MPKRKRQPAPKADHFDTYSRMRSVAMVFWENLVKFYEGDPLGPSINEKLCVSVFKDSAKRAAKEKK